MSVFWELKELIAELERGIHEMSIEELVAHRKLMHEKLSEEIERLEEEIGLSSDFSIIVDSIDSDINKKELISDIEFAADDLRDFIEYEDVIIEDTETDSLL